MKPYMSYWSGGYRKTPDQFTINMHKICAYFLKKNFGEVHLITDTESFNYFKDIGYSSISVDLDYLSKSYGEVWSLSKIYAYKIISQKGDPFVHVDYDVILWEGLKEDFKKSGIFAQSYELNVNSWYDIEKFEKNCPKPYLAEKNKVKDAINVGILGGHDLEFFYNYSSSALDLVLDPINKDFWLNYSNFHASWCKAVIPEQYYLAVCEKYFDKKIQVLFPQGWHNGEAEKGKYTHIWGAKNNPEVKDKIQKVVDMLKI